MNKYTFGTDQNHITVESKNLPKALAEVKKFSDYKNSCDFMNLRTVEKLQD